MGRGRCRVQQQRGSDRGLSVTILCAHHASVVAATIRAVPHLDPDERDRLADDLARQCQQCRVIDDRPATEDQ